jgi:acid phosphatase family membrane protein YuiD
MPFIIAIAAGVIAQAVKVVSFLIVEKRVNYRRFVQADGAPNLHSTTFSALTIAIGRTAGFDSVVFGLALCMTSIILVDTMNVKNAASRQAEAVELLMSRLRGRAVKTIRGNSYTPIDVFSGVVLGGIFCMIVYG